MDPLLSAFPLTPLTADGRVDLAALARITRHLVAVEGIGEIAPLGSTGVGPYLDTASREAVVQTVKEHAGTVPVLAGISALTTEEVLRTSEAVQRAGADAVLLAPVSYLPLAADEVVGLYERTSAELSVPFVVYDNPTTTRFTFADETHAAIAALPQAAAIKLPGVPAGPEEARERIAALRAIVPDRIRLGVSGDAHGVPGLIAGCDAWYTALGGTLATPLAGLVDLLRAGRAEEALAGSRRLDPIWGLFARHGGSLRVISAIAQQLGLVDHSPLPAPLRDLAPEVRAEIARIIEGLELRP